MTPFRPDPTPRPAEDMPPDLAAALAPLRETPARDPLAARRGRAAFLAEAAQLAQPTLRRRAGWRAVAAAIGLMLGATGGMAFAAEASGPRDAFYPVKLVIEDTRLALIADPARRADALGALLARRGLELEGLEAGDPATVRVLARQAELRDRLKALQPQPEPRPAPSPAAIPMTATPPGLATATPQAPTHTPTPTPTASASPSSTSTSPPTATATPSVGAIGTPTRLATQAATPSSAAPGATLGPTQPASASPTAQGLNTAPPPTVAPATPPAPTAPAPTAPPPTAPPPTAPPPTAPPPTAPPPDPTVVPIPKVTGVP